MADDYAVKRSVDRLCTVKMEVESSTDSQATYIGVIFAQKNERSNVTARTTLLSAA